MRLPADVVRPFEVFVNGVAQEEGRDYRVEGREIVFDDRLLKKEGRLGIWRWTLIFLGLVGSYKQNDSVDVHWRTPGGDQKIAVYLDIVQDDAQP